MPQQDAKPSPLEITVQRPADGASQQRFGIPEVIFLPYWINFLPYWINIIHRQ
jgi:hypothetical protein